MKLANPLNYPLAVAAGGLLLVAGVRFANLPSALVLPLSAIVATAGAVVLQSREPERLNLGNPELERELLGVKQQAKALAEKATELRAEASRLLTSSMQMELLSTVQFACDRALELPGKLDQLARRLQGKDSLLAVADLQKQLTTAQMRLRNTTDGAAKDQLRQLIQSLERNIQLAKQGQDARQAQVVSLSRLILDSAGVLQSMQNQLRTANLQDAAATEELQTLSDELKLFQENVDLLV
jgi:chromosome segregation ATPase